MYGNFLKSEQQPDEAIQLYDSFITTIFQGYGQMSTNPRFTVQPMIDKP